jgi:hypothetical protein
VQSARKNAKSTAKVSDTEGIIKILHPKRDKFFINEEPRNMKNEKKDSKDPKTCQKQKSSSKTAKKCEKVKS